MLILILKEFQRIVALKLQKCWESLLNLSGARERTLNVAKFSLNFNG